ncbi:MAG: transporter [Muribaculaceae bacterium]|nr:transporter [Muribaculaceae bacterium]
MKPSQFIARIKPWMLPIAMLLGIIFHDCIGHVAFLSKYLIFVMLLITFCRVRPNEFHLGRYIWYLLGVQTLGAAAVYLALLPFSHILAAGAFICILCPTATAAPVITGMLGGSVGKVATYSLVSNVAVALIAPPLLSWIGPQTGETSSVSFIDSLTKIGVEVMPVILGPLAVALIMQRFSPRAAEGIAHHQGLSFYIWAFALIIVVGNAVSFMLAEPSSMVPSIMMLAGVSLIACAAQFYIGRRIGMRFGDPISAAQSLGQKNTVLAIWLALTYMNPVVSAAPAAYVAWHNTVNSIQLYRHTRRSRT